MGLPTTALNSKPASKLIATNRPPRRYIWLIVAGLWLFSQNPQGFMNFGRIRCRRISEGFGAQGAHASVAADCLASILDTDCFCFHAESRCPPAHTCESPQPGASTRLCNLRSEAPDAESTAGGGQPWPRAIVFRF